MWDIIESSSSDKLHIILQLDACQFRTVVEGALTYFFQSGSESDVFEIIGIPPVIIAVTESSVADIRQTIGEY